MGDPSRSPPATPCSSSASATSAMAARPASGWCIEAGGAPDPRHRRPCAQLGRSGRPTAARSTDLRSRAAAATCTSSRSAGRHRRRRTAARHHRRRRAGHQPERRGGRMAYSRSRQLVGDLVPPGAGDGPVSRVARHRSHQRQPDHREPRRVGRRAHGSRSAPIASGRFEIYRAGSVAPSEAAAGRPRPGGRFRLGLVAGRRGGIVLPPVSLRGPATASSSTSDADGPPCSSAPTSRGRRALDTTGRRTASACWSANWCSAAGTSRLQRGDGGLLSGPARATRVRGRR